MNELGLVDGLEKLTNGNIDAISLFKLALSYGASERDACLYAGISYERYLEILKEEPELKKEIERLKSAPIMLAYESLVRGIKKDPHLALKYLERVRRDDFGGSASGGTDVTVNLNIIKGGSND